MKINPNLIQDKDMEIALSNLPENIDDFKEEHWQEFIKTVFLPIIYSFKYKELDESVTSLDLPVPDILEDENNERTKVLSTDERGSSNFKLKAYIKKWDDFKDIIVVTPTLVESDDFVIPFKGKDDKTNFEEMVSLFRDTIIIYYPKGKLEIE